MHDSDESKDDDLTFSQNQLLSDQIDEYGGDVSTFVSTFFM